MILQPRELLDAGSGDVGQGVAERDAINHRTD